MCFDTPSILSLKLRAGLNISQEQLGSLFAAYSAPNSVLPFVLGAVFAKFGVWRTTLAIGAASTLGVLGAAGAVALGSYPLLLASRGLFGLGGDSIFTATDVLISEWFRADGEMGLAYGLSQSAAQAGSFIAFYALPPLGDATGTWQSGFYMGACVIGLAFALLCLARVLDARAVGKELLDAEGQGKPAADAEAGAAKAEGGKDAVTAAVAPDEAAPPATGCCALCLRVLHSPVGRLLSLPELIGMPREAWAPTVGILAYIPAFYGMLAYGATWLQQEGGYSQQAAGQIIGVISICSAVLSAPVGLAFDKWGARTASCAVAFAASTAAFAALAWMTNEGLPQAVDGGTRTGWDGTVGGGIARLFVPALVSVLALCYAVLPAALYPSFADMVPEDIFAPVYSTISALMSLSLVTTYSLIGRVTNDDDGGDSSSSDPSSLGGSSSSSPAPFLGDTASDKAASSRVVGYTGALATAAAICFVGALAQVALLVWRWRRRAAMPKPRPHMTTAAAAAAATAAAAAAAWRPRSGSITGVAHPPATTAPAVVVGPASDVLGHVPVVSAGGSLN